MFCQKCGTRNREDATVCAYCGLQLVAIPGQPAQTVPPPPPAAPQIQQHDPDWAPKQHSILKIAYFVACAVIGVGLLYALFVTLFP